MSAKEGIMPPLYVLDYDYLKRDDTIIDKLQLKSEDYKECAKNSKFKFEKSELIYGILQFCKENEFCEFVIHFSMNGRNLLCISEEELKYNNRIKATFGTSQLWFYIGMIVYKVCKIKVITNEKAMINKDLINFIAITMEELGLNKKDLKVTCSSTINPQIIETDRHNLNKCKKSIINSKVDINYQLSSATLQRIDECEIEEEKECNIDTNTISNITCLALSAKGIKERNYDSTFNESIDKTSTKAFNNLKYEEILLSSSKSSASKSISVTSTSKSKDDKNSNELVNDLLVNREHFEEILRKCTTHFKGKEKQEVISFIKTFHNLVTQHVGKHLKTKPIYLFSNLLSSAVMFMLVKIGVLEGDVIRFLSESQMWTLNKLATSISVNIDLAKLNLYMTDNNLQKVIIKPTLKNSFELSGDIEDCTHICFYMIETAINSNFFRDKNELTSIAEPKNLMGNILDRYRKPNDYIVKTEELKSNEEESKCSEINTSEKLDHINKDKDQPSSSDQEKDHTRKSENIKE